MTSNIVYYLSLCYVDMTTFVIISAEHLIDFTSKEAMENRGWVFNWDDQYVFAPGGSFCVGVPSTSYCGFYWNGQGTISFTLRNGENGVATLRYGQSWDTGSISVSKNDDVIDSRDTRGDSEIKFDYSAGDILRITENYSVINIHSLVMKSSGM